MKQIVLGGIAIMLTAASPAKDSQRVPSPPAIETTIAPPSPAPPVLRSRPVPTSRYFQMVDLPEIGDNDETIGYSKAKKWRIRIDKTTALGCFAVGAFANETVIRIAVDARDDSTLFSIGSNYWRTLKPGEKKPLSIRLDMHEPWVAKGLVMTTLGFRALAVDVSDAGFLKEMRTATTLVAWSNSIQLGAYSLQDVPDALAGLAQCQAFVNSTVDPFASEVDPRLGT